MKYLVMFDEGEFDELTKFLDLSMNKMKKEIKEEKEVKEEIKKRGRGRPKKVIKQ
jgi:predicted ArsR family transcriptional regulator